MGVTNQGAVVFIPRQLGHRGRNISSGICTEWRYYHNTVTATLTFSSISDVDHPVRLLNFCMLTAMGVSRINSHLILILYYYTHATWQF